MRQVQAIVSGRVQGVCFRAETRDVARRLGLKGYVRNRPDGTVEAVAAGDDAALRDFIDYLNQGPSLARVDKVDLSWDTDYETPDPFTVQH
ncbi:MAG: acylphosphatase [Candidatus Eisenbacteria bacterium]|nr:acylphosphatase [Candidatus Eisenbacteria bacterium]